MLQAAHEQATSQQVAQAKCAPPRAVPRFAPSSFLPRGARYAVAAAVYGSRQHRGAETREVDIRDRPSGTVRTPFQSSYVAAPKKAEWRQG